ncbi:type IV secretory system conjugative DNA transfer family protein [Streptomyces cinereoruber]|uniref:type IV secretory system conjugative DNA transfer family protein n=1 Tax=Streptomyces cinereoruber TaxID=67260 RepID=UPI003634EB8F
MTWLSCFILLLVAVPVGVIAVRFASQREHDHNRKTYLLTFPTDLSEDRVVAWLRSISGSLHKRGSRIFGVPTIVFETWATEHGIVHRLKVPWQEGDYIAGQLRTLIPGITVAEDDRRPTFQWTRAVELGMRSPSRQLRISNHADLSASLLSSVSSIGADEVVMMQWVLTPAVPERPPAKDARSHSDEFSYKAAFTGTRPALRDELDDRRKKLEEQNLQGVGRIAAVAGTEARAVHLIHRVQQSLAATRSSANGLVHKTSRPSKLIERINEAAAPMMFPAQFSISELAAVVAWPIGQPFVAGLPQGSTRHLAATGDVSRVGRVLGHSNYPGNERPIALGYREAVHHMYVGGSTGTGKSTLMANSFAQDVAAGYGGIVIDASNSDSNESLFSRALAYVPPERLDDVIVVDVNRSRNKPVGFNVLDQGNPRVVVDHLTDLFGHLYQDTKGVWTRQLMFHALYTLAEIPGMTFVDLVPLLTPRTSDEVVWADEVKRKVKDPELRQFWQRWENFSQSERDRYSQPLMNRAWQLISRPEARYIVGQSESSFKMRDVLAGNKILLVSLAGLPVETSSLLGTLLVNALWTAAQGLTPEKPNFLYLDEFQLMTRLPMGLDDMLARARKHRLGVTLGTQYLEDLPLELKNAVINNARSRVIFQSSAREARTWRNEFGGRYVDEADFTHIRKYEAIAQLATEQGIGAPVTIRSLAPIPTTGVVREAVAISDQKYGRALDDVESQMVERRKGTPSKKAKRPPIGVREWGT